MPSLKKRVTHQRDRLMAHGPGIRVHGERIRERLRHPVVLIPAFLGGLIVGRRTPELLRALPRLSERMGLLSKELTRLQAIVRLIAALLPPRLGPSSAATDDASNA